MRNRLFYRILVLGIGFLFTTSLFAQTNELPRSTPESQGVSSKAVMAVFDSLMSLPLTEIHSVVVLRHGSVIGEIYPKPFDPSYRHTMYSCSKTFVAVAVGLAIEDNRLRLDDRVASIFPELLPDSVSPELADMTVRHLLTMTSGITPDWNMRNQCKDWIRVFLAKPVDKPGVNYGYDSMVTYMLSAIVQRVTGKKISDYLQERIFTPMNVTEWAWEESPEGINTGGWGLHIQPESLAKFGLLLLNKGSWNGEQLISADWINEMTKKQVETGGDDYGYQTWISKLGNGFRADGALGQYIFVGLDQDMVVVITEATLGNTMKQKRLVWEGLMASAEDNPLPESRDYLRLQKKQTSYKLPEVKGKATSKKMDGWHRKTIELDKNPLGWKSVRLAFEKKMVTMEITEDNGNQYELVFGYKQWEKIAIKAFPPYSITPIDRFKGIEGPFEVAGSYAWNAEDKLQLKAHYVNWVSSLDIIFSMDKEKVSLLVQPNYRKEPYIITGKVDMP